MSIKISIETPCHEDWEKMSIGIHSRHCKSCQKDVIDFTEKTRREILEYLLMHPNEQICGRMALGQYDYSIEEVQLAADNLISKTASLLHKEMIAASLALMLASSELHAGNTEHSNFIKIETRIETSISNSKLIAPEDSTFKKKIGSDTLKSRASDSSTAVFIDKPKYHIAGYISCTFPSNNFVNSAPIKIETYKANYKYGYDSLTALIHSNLEKSYPSIDTVKGTTVEVQVTISKKGKLKQVKILNSNPSHLKLEEEIIMTVKRIDEWEAAIRDGFYIDSRLVIYLKF